jgi:hypothetical protein
MVDDKKCIGLYKSNVQVDAFLLQKIEFGSCVTFQQTYVVF